MPRRAKSRTRLKKVVERSGERDHYEYYPLGQHVVIAPGVCRGRPTFKGTRIEVTIILDWLGTGQSIAEIIEGYPRLTTKAVQEAIGLANKAFQKQFPAKAR